MKDIRYTELFYSLQGEGYRVGVPSVFLRLFGCNFECKGFSNPEMKDPNIIPVINLNSIKDEDLELGCDSRYSWHKDYRNLAIKSAPHDLANKLLDFTREKYEAASQRWPAVSPSGSVLSIEKGRPLEGGTMLLSCAQIPDWVITGGEPFMQQEQLEGMLRHAMYVADIDETGLLQTGMPYITFETSATIDIRPSLAQTLMEYMDGYGEVHFSNSPKLSFTGEHRSAALKPQVIGQQSGMDAIMNFKFVVRPLRQDFDEMMEFMIAYQPAMVNPTTTGIYVMPVGASLHQQAAIATQVAELALEYGVAYSPRLQCDLWANKIGT